MQRARIVDGAGDATRFQSRLRGVARGGVGEQHRVDGPGAGTVRHPGGDFQDLREFGIVDRGDFFAPGHFRLEHIELGQQDRRLQGVHPAIHADTLHRIAGASLAMGSQRPVQSGALRGFGEQRAAIAIGAKRLGGKEAGGGGVGGFAQPLTVQASAEALRAVIQSEQVFARGDGLQSRPVRRLPEQIDADDRARAQAAGFFNRCNTGFEVCQVDLEGSWIDIDKNRRRAQ